ncbi:hypothetical protein EXIGLDRAFT_767072 [Exidia glandulosa HHB12029]|uniref:Uncharacterized protein n=1 Tax=Exidia glandulosa HHB12029 TaxID=1314781 RepID=A0A165J9V1_EXIGL|nr:hypothetical protein EXIGLDRAFT_767072 [Exidia glandulosa HHB12029]
MSRLALVPIYSLPQPCARTHVHSTLHPEDPRFVALRIVQRDATADGVTLLYDPEKERLVPFTGIYIQNKNLAFAERSPSSYDAVLQQFGEDAWGMGRGLPRLHCNCAVDGKIVREASFVRWSQDFFDKKWYAECHAASVFEGGHFTRRGCGMKVPLLFYVNPGPGHMNTVMLPPADAFRIVQGHPALHPAATRVRGRSLSLSELGLAGPRPGTPSSTSGASHAHTNAPGNPSAPSSSSTPSSSGSRKRSLSASLDGEEDLLAEEAIRKRRRVINLLHDAMDEKIGLTAVEREELSTLTETEFCKVCRRAFLPAEFRKHVKTH